ncbi:hypothetical protein TcasGA2_TC034865 [Tribolium castaneum]|uniref:Uncharacterized protein n=1 Tax=Tribolium castaneum TaxID=7070 RepID=A0A139WC51_TRICA|nr:hypothetical protein TcasGA2_TC034865 [Tribolium castaneum]
MHQLSNSCERKLKNQDGRNYITLFMCFVYTSIKKYIDKKSLIVRNEI